MDTTPTPVEFYEAQMRPQGQETWFRLGGKTLDGARATIERARQERRIDRRFVASDDPEIEYRIRHFIGTATNLEA